MSGLEGQGLHEFRGVLLQLDGDDDDGNSECCASGVGGDLLEVELLGFGGGLWNLFGHDISFRLRGSHYRVCFSCEGKSVKLVVISDWSFSKVY